MLLNTEELLALAHGDTEPDRLADLLDRLEHCPESAEALQVIVSLRANRAEALEALRLAADADVTSTPIPFPAARVAPSTGWVTQGLRLAASVAIVAIVGTWAANNFFAVDTTELKTETYANIVGIDAPAGVEFTSTASRAIVDAYNAMEAHEYAAARRTLEGVATDADGRVPLYRGTSLYFLGEYELALREFVAIRHMASIDDSGTRHQAAWYEANALLALDQPMRALDVFEEVKSAPADYRFSAQATVVYAELRAALGLTSPK